MRIGGYRRPCRRRDHSTQVEKIASGRSEVRNSRRKPDVRSRSSRTMLRRSEPGSWPPVEPELGTGGESRWFLNRRSHEDATASESWRVGHWGSRRMQHRLYCEFIKIETPEAPASGVFNLQRFFAVHPLNRLSINVRLATRALTCSPPLCTPLPRRTTLDGENP